MGFLSDFMEEVKRRVSFDVDMTGKGLCLNINWDGNNKTNDSDDTNVVDDGQRYFSISVVGTSRPVGGVVIAILTCKQNNLFAPILNEVDRALFLSGFFSKDCRTMFSDMIPKCDNKNTTHHVEFTNGYTLDYTILCASSVRTMSEENLRQEIVNNIETMLDHLYDDPSKATYVYDMSNKLEWFHEIVKTSSADGKVYYHNTSVDTGGKMVSLASYISEYIYNMTIRDAEKELRNMSKNASEVEIPSGADDQRNWADNVLPKLVSGKNYDKFVYDWIKTN